MQAIQAPANAGAPLSRTSHDTVGVRLSGARLMFGGRPLFDGLDVHLPAGEWTCLLGPSGVGKSSLVRLIAGLAGDAAGGIATDADGRPLDGRVAWMAQQDLLMPWLSVLDNVRLGSRLRGRPDPGDGDRARAMLARVGLVDRAGERPGGLSGGERQRVALARTLMEDRPVVLMDEPFSALDAPTRLRLQDMAARLLTGRTVLMVTHDPLEALRLGCRVLVLSGSPARLSEPIQPPGPPPRRADDPAILELQGRLLTRLTEAVA